MLPELSEIDALDSCLILLGADMQYIPVSVNVINSESPNTQLVVSFWADRFKQTSIENIHPINFMPNFLR